MTLKSSDHALTIAYTATETWRPRLGVGLLIIINAGVPRSTLPLLPQNGFQVASQVVFLDNIDVTTAIGIYYDYYSSAGFPIQTLPYQQQSTYQVASPTPVRIILTSPALSLSTRTTALEQDIQLGQRMLYRPQLHWRLSFKRRLPLFHRVRALQPLLYQERQP